MSQFAHDAGSRFAAMLPDTDEHGQRLRVSVLTRVGCHLCERALSVVEEVCVAAQVGYAAVDIDAQDSDLRAELLARYGEWLPVTFVDGRSHDYWTIDAARLRQSLE